MENANVEHFFPAFSCGVFLRGVGWVPQKSAGFGATAPAQHTCEFKVELFSLTVSVVLVYFNLLTHCHGPMDLSQCSQWSSTSHRFLQVLQYLSLALPVTFAFHSR